MSHYGKFHQIRTLHSDEPKAENECETCLALALKIDPENVDALQTLANLRVIRAKDSEAVHLLRRVVKVMLNGKDITTLVRPFVFYRSK
jgi:cytochrome c-type biogenesis protein CcmH/NrfG